MAVRVALLTEPVDAHRMALLRSLADDSRIELRAFRTGAPSSRRRQGADADDTAASVAVEDHALKSRRRKSSERGFSLTSMLRSLPFRSWFQLVKYRPDLVICNDVGQGAMQAALYRRLAGRSRLLLFTTESRHFGLRERLVLSSADGVLAGGHAVGETIAQAPVSDLRVFPLVLPNELEVFAECAEMRPAGAAHRIVYAGDLSPRSGAADFLIALARWAEQNPAWPVEIWWIGEGDLAGVLGAQPLPPSVSQRFLGSLNRIETAQAFAECGLLVVPSLTDDDRPLLDEALASGLPVLGSSRSRRTRRVVREDVTGWLFDPLRPGDMLDAIGRALNTPEERVARMRDRAQRLARPAAALDFSDGVRRAVAAVLADNVSEPSRRRARGPVSDVG